jgi:lipoprotein NlpI
VADGFIDKMSILMRIRIKQSFLLFSAVLLAGMSVFGVRPSYADAALLKTANKQITSKKYKVAARTITSAMNSGTLSDKEMAQALYRRGVAYNGLARYSLAIADLTGALWLEKLGGRAQKEAYRQRAIAYEAVGFKKLARRDLGKSGLRSEKASVSKNTPGIVAPSPQIPNFKTTVRSAKKTFAKPVSAKKTVIPAFRTSIATE